MSSLGIIWKELLILIADEKYNGRDTTMAKDYQKEFYRTKQVNIQCRDTQRRSIRIDLDQAEREEEEVEQHRLLSSMKCVP